MGFCHRQCGEELAAFIKPTVSNTQYSVQDESYLTYPLPRPVRSIGETAKLSFGAECSSAECPVLL
jgi:hypothetical protein